MLDPLTKARGSVGKRNNSLTIHRESIDSAYRVYQDSDNRSSYEMKKEWEERQSLWKEETALSEETVEWAINGLQASKLQNSNTRITNEIEDFKNSIKKNLQEHENRLDNLLLGSANSYKLQVSVPMTINYLMKAWAAAEGRDLSSVALQCMEIGLRETKRRGSIPVAAVKLYEQICEKRIALAEVNNQLDKFEKSIKNLKS